MPSTPDPTLASLEDNTLSFMFGHDFADDWSAEDDLLDAGIQNLPGAEPIADTRPLDFAQPLISQGLQTSFFHQQLADHDGGFHGHYQHIQPMDEGWATVTASSADMSGMPLARTPLNRTHSNIVDPAGFDPSSTGNVTMPLPTHRPQRPSSVPPLTNTESLVASPEQIQVEPKDMSRWGYRINGQRAWRCNFPQCRSRMTFHRACDLRKHYNRHIRKYHCRTKDCPQATGSGFPTSKDRARHEAKHDPGIRCDFEGCAKLFSRKDNMKDHFQRVHMPRGMSD